MPVIEGVIRETLRLVNNGAALRRNLGGSIQVDDKTIDNGAFMAYVIGDVHLNEKFYAEPFKFDPDRVRPHKRGCKNRDFRVKNR